MARRRLTQQQKRRIQAIQERRRQRLMERAEEQLPDGPEQSSQEGRVITRHGQNLLVADTSGDLHYCLSRQNIGHPVCGDRVVWQPTGPGEGVVTAILERSSVLARPNYSGEIRPLAANVTRLVVVMAPQPPPSAYLLDQYLVTAENLEIPALIACNKWDLMDQAAAAAFDEAFSHYEAIGYPLLRISARTEHGLAPLAQRLQDQTSILLGQSGVGKSSLIQALLPDLRIQVGRLSEGSGLGRHTTSATTLYQLPTGGQLIDSPGVRSFRLGNLDRHQLEHGFREFRPYLGHCRFSDCHHQQEPDCALVKAVESGMIHPQRLENFRHMAANLDKR